LMGKFDKADVSKSDMKRRGEEIKKRGTDTNTKSKEQKQGTISKPEKGVGESQPERIGRAEKSTIAPTIRGEKLLFVYLRETGYHCWCIQCWVDKDKDAKPLSGKRNQVHVREARQR